MIRLLISSVLCVTLIGTLANANKAAEKAEKSAQKYERQQRRNLYEPVLGRRFFVQPDVAASIVATESERFFPGISEFSHNRVSSNWQHEVEFKESSTTGESAKQTRKRSIVTIGPGPEIEIEVTVVKESRTINAGSQPTTWLQAKDFSTANQLDRAIRKRLAAVETSNIAGAIFNEDIQRLRQIAEPLTPTGYRFIEAPPNTLLFERTLSETKWHKKTGDKATWNRRMRLTVSLPDEGQEGSRIRVSANEQNQFISAVHDDAWVDSTFVNDGPAKQLLRAILINSGPEISLPKPTALPWANEPEPLSEPPELPPLRTVAQIQHDANQALREEGTRLATGYFRIYVTEAMVRPQKSDGSTWDADFSGTLNVASSIAVSYAGAPMLAEDARNITATLTEQLPTSPDIRATLAYPARLSTSPTTTQRPNLLQLPKRDDALVATWSTTVIWPFKGTYPIPMKLILVDEDPLDKDDDIGSCTIHLTDILSAGGQHRFACGLAAVTMKAEWVRPLPQ